MAAVVAAGMLCLAAAGCMVTFQEYEVRNESPNAVLVAIDFGECSGDEPSIVDWLDLAPGQSAGREIVRLAGGVYQCLLVADARGRIIFRDSSKEGGVFAVRGISPTVTRVADRDTRKFKGLWLLAIYLVPVALGMPFALFITGRYFYRYYISKRGHPPA